MFLTQQSCPCFFDLQTMEGGKIIFQTEFGLFRVNLP